MPRPPQVLLAVLLLVSSACNEEARPRGDAARSDGLVAVDGARDLLAAASDAHPSEGRRDSTSPSSCEPFGRYGIPKTTFTLPAPTNGDLYFPDVQKSFPAVDWSSLDRLYIPAGTYNLINLGNLPQREASKPLVITNLGGQVRIFPPKGSTQGYVWAMTGGANWILSGRYDADSKTGDAKFPGHRCGDYAASRAHYGFLSDDDYRSGGHMGLAITDANRFEVEFVEITRAGFAGLRVNNSKKVDGTVASFEDVRLHDLYIHDTKSEAVYFGSTQAPPTPLSINLKVYNNRLVRSGTEALQVQNLGPGCEIHHNVVAFGAIDWRASFAAYQDSNTQLQLRQGKITIHHNVFVGGASATWSIFSGPEGADPGRTVELTDNYLDDSRSLGVYLGGTSGSDSTYLFARNAFRGMVFGYGSLDPAATDPGTILRLGGSVTSSVQLDANTWEGSKKLIEGLSGGSGKVGAVTATGNINATVAAVEFVESGYPAGAPVRQLEMWTDVATRAPGSPPMTYEAGALVTYGAELYRALAKNTNKIPPDNPTLWSHLPLPADDLRLRPGSVWEQRKIGLER